MPWLERAALARKRTASTAPPPRPLEPGPLSPVPFLFAGSAAPLGPVGQPRSPASLIRAELRRFTGLRRGLAQRACGKARPACIPIGNDPRYVGLAYAVRDGRAAAGLRQLGMQLAGIAFVAALNVAVTSAVCLVVGLLVPLRLGEEQLAAGDDAIHGEDAYAVWGDGETYEQSVHGSRRYQMTANPLSSKVDEII